MSQLRSQLGAFLFSLLADLAGRDSHDFALGDGLCTADVLDVGAVGSRCAHGGWRRAACQRCRWKVLGVLALFVLNRRHEDFVDAFSVHVDDLKTQTVPLELFRL